MQMGSIKAHRQIVMPVMQTMTITVDDLEPIAEPAMAPMAGAMRTSIITLHLSRWLGNIEMHRVNPVTGTVCIKGFQPVV